MNSEQAFLELGCVLGVDNAGAGAGVGLVAEPALGAGEQASRLPVGNTVVQHADLLLHERQQTLKSCILVTRITTG